MSMHARLIEQRWKEQDEERLRKMREKKDEEEKKRFHDSYVETFEKEPPKVVKE